jgi:quercetin dioxygenase-like cupin family protein
MPFINLSDIKSKEMVAGFHGKFVHSANTTVAHWNIKKGSTIPVHQHINEMIVNVISGELELTIGDEKKMLFAGMCGVIPGNVPHTAFAHTDCYVIDVFYPVRPEYNND